MIGAFARMLRSRDRILHVEETKDGTACSTSTTTSLTQDTPPPAFVRSLPEEGGTIHVSPMVDALVDWLRQQRKASLPHVHENGQ